MDGTFFTLFFAKSLLILAAAYGAGFLAERKIPGLDFLALRRCALLFMILYTVGSSMENNLGGQGGLLGVIDFIIPYLAVWALLMGMEKRIIEIYELFLPSFYREIEKPTKKSPLKK